MSPVLAGFIGAGVLVVAVVTLVFLWVCCQRRRRRLTGAYKLHGIQSEPYDPATDPPYKFIHMLKGISIYPETLTNNKRVVRLARKAGWRGGRRHGATDDDQDRGGAAMDGANVGASAAENGQVPYAHCTPEEDDRHCDGANQHPPRLDRDLPIRADYSCLESASAPSSSSSSSQSSATATPFTPATDDELQNLGELSLAVDYNFPKKALVVTIQAARGLPAVDERAGSADPYIKMTILPEKKHRVKTRVLRRTRQPVFDETFTFYGVPYSALPELTLHFLVLSFDRFARDDVIGEAVVPLAGVDPSTGKVQLTQIISKRSMQVRMPVGCANLCQSEVGNPGVSKLTSCHVAAFQISSFSSVWYGFSSNFKVSQGRSQSIWSKKKELQHQVEFHIVVFLVKVFKIFSEQKYDTISDIFNYRIA